MKGLLYRSFVVWLIAVLGRSQLIHVCIADNRVTLDQTITGPRFYDTLAFTLQYPRLAWCFELKTPRPIRTELASSLGPVRVIRTIVRRLTGGAIESNDCVTATAMVLRDAGVPVPHNVITPCQLWDYLRSAGHTMIDLQH